MNKPNPAQNRSSRATAPRRATAWALALTGLLAGGSALGEQKFQAITGALESGTRLVSLPALAGGTLAATECASGCPVMRLRFDANTQYFIGREAVPYAKFRKAATKGDLFLLVSYRLSDNTLTRLRIPAVDGK
jgi:hypothetical protein